MERIYNYFPENDNVGYSPVTDTIKVYHLISGKSGEAVKNQFVINYQSALVKKFQSYNTICLVWDGVSCVLTVYPEAFGRSVTTSKYSRSFLHDELCFSDAEIDEVKKLAKRESFGRDCPLYIQF